MRILGTLPETCSEEEMRNTGRQDLAIFVCWLVSKSLQEMLVTTDLFVKNAGFQVPSLLVQPVWGLPRNTAYPGYSNNNGPNLDENWPKARFQSHWEESLRKGAGHNCTAHLWPHREQRRGTQAPRRAGLQQLKEILTVLRSRDLLWGHFQILSDYWGILHWMELLTCNTISSWKSLNLGEMIIDIFALMGGEGI